MHLPAKLKMLIGLGLSLTAGKSLAQNQTPKQADMTPLHRIVMVEGKPVKLGREFFSNTLDTTQLTNNSGTYHFAFEAKNKLTDAELEISDTNRDGVLNKDDEYLLRVRQQKGNVRQEHSLQHTEDGVLQAFKFHNGNMLNVVTQWGKMPLDSQEEADMKAIKTEINKNFPGIK